MDFGPQCFPTEFKSYLQQQNIKFKKNIYIYIHSGIIRKLRDLTGHEKEPNHMHFLKGKIGAEN